MIKCVLASRPDDDIKDSPMERHSLKRFFHLILEKKNEKDIKSFIRVKMNRLRDVYSSSLPNSSNSQTSTTPFEDMIQYATNYLDNTARGVFMWVEIVTRN